MLAHSEGGDHVRPIDARQYRGVGRRHPDVAVIRIVIQGTSVAGVEDKPIVPGHGMLHEVIVDEVPEDAERLDDDQRRDQEQRDDTGTTGDRARCHEQQSITPTYRYPLAPNATRRR